MSICLICLVGRRHCKTSGLSMTVCDRDFFAMSSVYNCDAKGFVGVQLLSSMVPGGVSAQEEVDIIE